MAQEQVWFDDVRRNSDTGKGMKTRDSMLTGRGWHRDAKASAKPLKVQVKNGNNVKNKLIGSD